METKERERPGRSMEEKGIIQTGERTKEGSGKGVGKEQRKGKEEKQMEEREVEELYGL